MSECTPSPHFAFVTDAVAKRLDFSSSTAHRRPAPVRVKCRATAFQQTLVSPAAIYTVFGSQLEMRLRADSQIFVGAKTVVFLITQKTIEFFRIWLMRSAMFD